MPLSVYTCSVHVHAHPPAAGAGAHNSYQPLYVLQKGDSVFIAFSHLLKIIILLSLATM